MGEQNYTYRDTAFDLNQAYYYTLLIQVSATSFSFAITYKKQLLAWGNNCDLSELTAPQALNEELTAIYNKVIIGLPANGFSLLPAELYSKEQLPNYARLLDVKPDEKVLAQVLDEENFIIYKVYERLIAAVQGFGLDNVVYLNKGWISAVAQNNPQNYDLYLHIENSSAGFLYYKDGKIRFYNSFDFKSEDDLVYYASFVTEELGLVAQNTRLQLSGHIQPEGSYRKRLSDFFPDVVYFNPAVLDLPTDVPSQQILTLASLSLCGSLEVH